VRGILSVGQRIGETLHPRYGRTGVVHLVRVPGHQEGRLPGGGVGSREHGEGAAHHKRHHVSLCVLDAAPVRRDGHVLAVDPELAPGVARVERDAEGVEHQLQVRTRAVEERAARLFEELARELLPGTLPQKAYFDGHGRRLAISEHFAVVLAQSYLHLDVQLIMPRTVETRVNNSAHRRRFHVATVNHLFLPRDVGCQAVEATDHHGIRASLGSRPFSLPLADKHVSEATGHLSVREAGLFVVARELVEPQFLEVGVERRLVGKHCKVLSWLGAFMQR